MSKTTDVPDVIFISDTLGDQTWSEERIDPLEIKYLRATPERELATLMHKLIKRVYTRVQFDSSTVWAYEDNDKYLMGQILHTIKRREDNETN
jgi:hypothetical protein